MAATIGIERHGGADLRLEYGNAHGNERIVHIAADAVLLVVLGEQEACQRDVRIDKLLDFIELGHDGDNALFVHFLARDWYYDAIRSAEGVIGQNGLARRAVDDDVIVKCVERLEQPAEDGLAAHAVSKLDNERIELHAGWDEFETLKMGVVDRILLDATIHELIDALSILDGIAKDIRCVHLHIKID